jgi:hypothetical protein
MIKMKKTIMRMMRTKRRKREKKRTKMEDKTMISTKEWN